MSSEPKTYTMDVELFAAGKWNGYRFSEADLHELVENFNALREVQDVALKMGHNEEQLITDGLPAIGWVDKLRIAPSKKDEKPKLIGTLIDVPEIVYKAFQKKLYKNVSIELGIGVEHKDKRYKYVLTAVALLGADIPAVNTLADLQAYMSSEQFAKVEAFEAHNFSSELVADKVVSFSIDDKGDSKMSDSEKELSELKLKMANDAAANAAALAAKDAEIQKFAKESEERAVKEQADKIKFAREAVTKVLEDAVTNKHILPGQREKFSKLLRVDDDKYVVDIVLDDVKALIDTEKKVDFSQQGKGGSGMKDDTRVHEDAGEELDRLAKVKMGNNPELKYDVALFQAMRENNELAKEHIVDKVH